MGGGEEGSGVCGGGEGGGREGGRGREEGKEGVAVWGEVRKGRWVLVCAGSHM